METLIVIFGFDVSAWIGGAGLAAVIGLALKFFFKKGWTAKIKKTLGFAVVITKELGEAFLATSNALGRADLMIEADGKLKENSIKELIAAGKMAKLEWDDVIVTISPKKALNK